MTLQQLRPIGWWVLLVVSMTTLVAGGVGGALLSGDGLGPLMLACLVVGALVARRRPDNPMGWVFLGSAAVAGLDVVAGVLAESVVAAPGASPWWAIASLWAYRWLWLVLVWLLTAMTFLLFPDGLTSARWRPVLWLSVAVAAVLTLGLATAPTLIALDKSLVDNPVGVDVSVGSVGTALLLALAIGVMALSLLSLLLRARRAVGVERQQLRWFAFACVAFVVAGVLQTVVPALNGPLGQLLFAAASAFVPIACGVAILRYHLYDIGRIISRTAAYAIVTGLLLATYALVVTSVSRLLGESSTLAVAAATLAAAALVRPLLTRVQRVVDRRFNREKVDAQRAVDGFGARLTDGAEPEHVVAELQAVVARTLQPSGSAVWIGGPS